MYWRQTGILIDVYPFHFNSFLFHKLELLSHGSNEQSIEASYLALKILDILPILEYIPVTLCHAE